MENPVRHPSQVLFAGEKPFPMMPAVDHYAGSEKLISKALQLQAELGPIFDITCDCEDGAPAGADRQHAEMVADFVMSDANRHGRVGARIHDIAHPAWQQDIEIIVGRAGQRLAFVTLPKVSDSDDVRVQLRELRRASVAAGLTRSIPVHVLIETHGALRAVWEIAAMPEVESLDFGLMDFVSGHHGAIPGSAMLSPGQFEHPLVVRAKCEIAAAALANGVVPSESDSKQRGNARDIRRNAERAEGRVTELEQKVAELDAALADQELYSRPNGRAHATALSRELAEVKASLADAMATWEAALVAAEALDAT